MNSATRHLRDAVDWAIARVAQANHGVITLDQLRALGLTQQAVAYRVATGRLHVIHEGVYAVGTPQLPRLGHYMAASRACGAPVTHRSSLGMQGVLRDNRAFVEITAGTRRGRSIDGIRAHAGALHPDDVGEVEGIPCSTVARALMEIAGTEPPYLLRAAVRQAARMEILDFGAVRASIARVKRPRGVRALRQILIDFDPEVLAAVNDFEERLWDLCIDYGLPRPRINKSLVVDGHTYIPDGQWRDRKVIVECDGSPHQQPYERVADLRRDRRLRSAGWVVRRIKWAQMVYEPERTAARLGQLLAAASSSGRNDKPSL